MRKIYLLIVLISFGCKNESSENNLSSILISKNSEIKYEEYFNGGQKDEMVNVQSITKSVISLLIGIAINEGKIKDENISIGEFFPKIEDKKKKVTIKHLLNHTSGIEWRGYLEHEEFLNSENPIDYVLTKNLIKEPGTNYNYNSGGTHLLSAILTKVSGTTTLQYAKEKIFSPLGITKIKWGKLNDGFFDGAGFSLELLPRDLIKFGGIFLKEHQSLNGALVSKEWIEKMSNNSLKKQTNWGLKNSKHGYGWYSSIVDNQQILYSMGYGGQFILIIPENELIIIATHNHDTADGIDQQVDFLKETFPVLMEEFGS